VAVTNAAAAYSVGTSHYNPQDDTESDSETRTSVAAGLSMGLKLAFLFTHFLPLALHPNLLVHQCLEVWKNVALQLIMKRPNQAIRKPFLSFRISVHLTRCITRQMSELFQIFSHRYVALPQ
jgi:hypothetical protein